MLPKENRLREKSDFRRVYIHKKSLANKQLVLYSRRNYSGETRFGFSISKKIGKAHERNLLKRQLREIIRIDLVRIKKGYDYIFVVRIPFKELDYKLKMKSVFNLLRNGKFLYE